MKGANVIFQDAHVSGHACQEEIKLIYSLVRPKYAIPVHGEYRHLKAQADTCRSLWAFRRTTFSSFTPEMCWSSDEKRAEMLPAMCSLWRHSRGRSGRGRCRKYRSPGPPASGGGWYHDCGSDTGDVSATSFCPDRISCPAALSMCVNPKDLMEEAQSMWWMMPLQTVWISTLSDWGKIKNVIKDSLSDFLWKRTKRSPMILPIIMEV